MIKGVCAVCRKTDLLLPSVKVDREAKSVTTEYLCRGCYLKACGPISSGSAESKEEIGCDQ